MTARTDNTILVAAPRDLVWDMTDDVESWPHLFSEYAEAEILSQQGGSLTIRLTTHPDENGRVFTWTSERTPDAKRHVVRSRRTDFSTGPFASMEIRWEFEEVPEGTQMRWVQEFALKPGLPFTEEQMAGHLTETTKEQMAVVRDQIELIARRRETELAEQH